MKKTYIAPDASIILLQLPHFIATSLLGDTDTGSISDEGTENMVKKFFSDEASESSEDDYYYSDESWDEGYTNW